jgi:uncharacterized protein (TIGR02118 family)
MLPRQGPAPKVSETGRRKVRMMQQIPGLRGYVQNRALPDPQGNEPPYDGFGELFFDSLEAMQEGLASPEGEATLADIPNFCDTQKLVRVLVEEVMFV